MGEFLVEEGPLSNGARSGIALTAALALAACGGGDGGSDVTPTPAPSPSPTPTASSLPPIDITRAARLLSQGTMGASIADVNQAVSQGYEGWIDAQIAMPRPISHWDWLSSSGLPDLTNSLGAAGFDPMMWRQLIVSQDQLRQRVGAALADYIVVGISSLNGGFRQFQMAAFMDVLLDHAFGNYRDLLQAITTNAAMASFLTFLRNRKANPATGAEPDENYARELMQLFTIGPVILAMDGTASTQETYGQADVSGLARVFTGLDYASGDGSTPDRLRQPLVMSGSLNETGASSFLGTTVTGGGMAAIGQALDTIFAHPNVPPFVSRRLIQSMVTSNPSSAYIGRVASVFANDGKGVRGNLAAVVKAILLDPEARADPLAGSSAGRLRSPVHRLTGWARASQAGSASNAWGIGDTTNPATRLGQSPGRSPSVFGFFRPGYIPPGSTLADNGLVAPEMQMVNEQQTVGYLNFMQMMIGKGIGDVNATYLDATAVAGDSTKLVDQINLVLAGGGLSEGVKGTIRMVVDGVSASGDGWALRRAMVATFLTMASTEYLVMR